MHEHEPRHLTPRKDDRWPYGRLAGSTERMLKLADGRVLDLVGVYEAAEIVGVERSRFARWLSPLRELRNAGRDGVPPGFRMPLPLADLKCGPVWLRSDIEVFARDFARRRRLNRSA